MSDDRYGKSKVPGVPHHAGKQQSHTAHQGPSITKPHRNDPTKTGPEHFVPTYADGGEVKNTFRDRIMQHEDLAAPVEDRRIPGRDKPRHMGTLPGSGDGEIVVRDHRPSRYWKMPTPERPGEGLSDEAGYNDLK